MGRNYRHFLVGTFSDDTTERLSMGARGLFASVLAHPRLAIGGAIRFGMAGLAGEFGETEEQVEEWLEELCPTNLVVYKDRWVAFPGFVGVQGRGASFEKGALRDLNNQCAPEWVRRTVFQGSPSATALDLGDSKPTSAPALETLPGTLPERVCAQEQEQDQQQHQEHETEQNKQGAPLGAGLEKMTPADVTATWNKVPGTAQARAPRGNGYKGRLSAMAMHLETHERLERFAKYCVECMAGKDPPGLAGVSTNFQAWLIGDWHPKGWSFSRWEEEMEQQQFSSGGE